MSSEQQGAILAIALFAAFADGKKDDLERENIRRLAESLAGDSQEPNLTRLYQDVLLKRITLASAATSLTDSGERQLAYEMAVCVCDVDGRKNDAEIRFLTELKGLLELAPRETAEVEREVEAITDMVQYAAPAAPAPLPAGPAVITVTNIPEAELDKSILNHAILTGALELLPQSWASLAIIPLQVKMVYSIGKVHGVDLDQGHIKEFIAATGVGVTSQYLEKFCRKLL